MADNNEESRQQPVEDQKSRVRAEEKCYRIQFRKEEQIFSASGRIQNLAPDEVVMAQTDHGLEPARLIGAGPRCMLTAEDKPPASFAINRRANREEITKYERLVEREKEAFVLCRKYIEKHKLAMNLIRVERFFNGSKIIFYFTAENRVDFRELVKDLVQEFRTRVEIRQIGVRHETKMIGGVGCCGRELCCCSFIKNFAPVSIKMAKEQNLPLNPSKISGICNRLLCCLTYEYEAYRTAKKNMPKQGKTITLDGRTYKVLQQNALRETITVAGQGEDNSIRTLSREEWEKAVPAQQPRTKDSPKGKKKSGGAKQ